MLDKARQGLVYEPQQEGLIFPQGPKFSHVSEERQHRKGRVASCHAHTEHGGAWASMGRTLEPISQDACLFYGDHVVLTDGAGKVPLASASGHPVAEACRTDKAVIHQNHGLLVASRDSIDDAAFTSTPVRSRLPCSPDFPTTTQPETSHELFSFPRPGTQCPVGCTHHPRGGMWRQWWRRASRRGCEDLR